MRNYFIHMNFEEIVHDLFNNPNRGKEHILFQMFEFTYFFQIKLNFNIVDNNANVELKGKQILLISCMIVAPN